MAGEESMRHDRSFDHRSLFHPARPGGLRLRAIGTHRVHGPLTLAPGLGADLVSGAAAPGPISLIGPPLPHMVKSAPEVLQSLANMRAKADLSFVEIARAECLEWDGRVFNHADIVRRFPDLLGQHPARAAYFRALGSWPARDIAALVADLPTAQRLTETDRAFLSGLRPQISTEASLEAAIEDICHRLGEVVFVTHFTAQRPDGTPLRARRNFVRLLAGILRRMGRAFTDPSRDVDAYGQARAVSGPGFNRYTSDFERHLCQRWLSAYVIPRLEHPTKEPRAPARQVPAGQAPAPAGWALA